MNRKILVASFAITAILAIATVLMFLLAPATEAATYTLTGSAPLTWNWTDPTRWSCSPGAPGNAACGSYPGNGPTAGDVASMSNSGYTVTINSAIPGAVTINQISSGVTIDVVSGGALTLDSASNMTQGIFRVSGGTVTIPTGASLTIGSVGGQTATLNLGSGTLTNNTSNGVIITAASTSASTFTWAGGTLAGTGSTTIQNNTTNAFLNLTGVAAMTLDGQTIDVNGNADYSSTTNALQMNNGAQINVNSTGTFNLKNDLAINSNGSGPPKIKVLNGTVTKSAATGNTNIFPQFDNLGTVNLSTGGITLKGGGSHGLSTFSTSATLPIDLDGGTNSFTVGSGTTSSWAGSQPVRLISGNLVVNSGFTVNATRFVERGGALTLNGGLNTSSAATGFTWSGGTMTIASTGAFNAQSGSTTVVDGAVGAMTLSGPGLFINDGTMTFASANGLTVNSGGVLQNNLGTFNYNAGAGLLTLNGTFLNEASRNFNLNSDNPINGTGTISNNGNVVKSGGIATTINPVLNNNSGASVSVPTSATSITLAGGGTHAGTFSTGGAGGTIEFGGGTHTLNTNTAFTNAPGTIKLSAGTLDVAASTLSIPQAFSQPGGTLTGTGALTLASDTWTGGSQTGAGSTTVSGATTISGASVLQLSTRTLTLNGNTTFTSSGTIRVDLGGTITNNAIFDIQSDGNTVHACCGGGSATFNNTGTLKKTIATGTSTFLAAVALNNTGTVGAATGTLSFQGGGTSSGDFSASVGATLDFAGGTQTVTLGAAKSFAGGGTISFTGGTTTIGGTGSYAVTGTTLVNGGTVNFNLPSSTTSTLTLSNGTLSGTGTLTVNTSAGWSGTGVMSGSGVTTIANTATLTVSGASNIMQLSTRTLNLNGNTTYTSTGSIRVDQGGTINNAALFDIQSDGNTLHACCGGGSALFSNSGTLRKGAGTGTSTFLAAVTLNNTGTVQATSGTLSLQGGGTSSGSFLATAPGTLDFSGGTQTVTLGVSNSFSGSGTISFSGGTTVIGGSGTYNVAGMTRINGGTATLNINGSTASFDLSGGTLSGSGTFTATGATTWSGSGSMSGSGTTTLANTGTLTVSGAANVMQLSTRTLNLNGNTTYASTGTIRIDQGGIINNAATFDIQSNGNTFHACCGGGTATFNNGGSLKKSAGGGTSTFLSAVVLNNTGTVQALSGTLSLQGGGASTGSFTATSPATLDFGGGTQTITLGGANSVGGSGTIGFSGGTTAIGGTGSYNVGGTTLINGGTANLNINGTTAALNLTSTLGGTGTLTVTGAATWSANGVMAGGGTTTIANTGSLNLSGAIMQLSSRTLNLNGNTTFTSAGAVRMELGSTVNNNAIFDFQNDGNFDPCCLGGVVTLNNAGTWKKSGASGISLIGGTLPFNNSGTVAVLSGTLRFDGVYTQTAGTTTSGPGSLVFSSPMQLNGGILNGTGTITGSIANNSGTVNPGTSPGALTISGNYTQGASGILNTELQGTTAGTLYDQLTVTGTATLNGTLNVTLLGGFTPANADFFDVLVFGSRSGDFATKNLPAFPNGAWTAAYTPTTLRLTAAVISADLAVTKTAPSPISVGQNAVFTVTVANSGPSNATNVSVTDSFSGGTFVSATPSQGTCSGTGPVTCNLGTIAASSSATITVKILATATGTITNSASATATEFDPSSGNNTASASVTVNPATATDVSITKAPFNLPSSQVGAGKDFTYKLTIDNNGSNPAANVVVTDTLPASLTFRSFSAPGWSCSFVSPTLTCSMASLSALTQSAIALTVGAPNTPGSVSNTAQVTTTTSDTNASNNSSSATVSVVAGNRPPVANPDSATTQLNTAVTINVVSNDADPDGDPITFGGNTPASHGSVTCTTAGSCTYTPNSGYVGGDAFTYTISDPNGATSTGLVTISVGCPAPASPISPTGGKLSSPIHFTWSAVPGATQHEVFVSNGGAFTSVGVTSNTFLDANVPDGGISWFVVSTVPGCNALQSATVSFNACNRPTAPIPSIVADTVSGQTVELSWLRVTGASKYEYDEAGNAAFVGATTKTIDAPGTSQRIAIVFTKVATTATPFFYRVRAISDCGQQAGDNSPTLRLVVLPPPPKNQRDLNITVPSGSQQVVVQDLFIPGIEGQTFNYTASTDQVFISVSPAAGLYGPDGITLHVSFNPAVLPNGTFTGTVILQLSPVSGAKVLGTTPKVSVPVSLSLVTPVTPAPSNTLATNALIFPSVGHLDGISSHWQSDLRLANVGFSKQQYVLRFTPSGNDPSAVKETTITIDSGQTTALDDIVRNWYGIGSLGDSANGVLQVRPLSPSGAKASDAPSVSLTTVASSRTYNVAAAGTLGQFVPAVQFSSFIGKAAANAPATVLGLQQIAQSSRYRTNVGLVEAAGQPASVTLSVFNDAGSKLKDIPVDLNANEQKQLNSLLATAGLNGIDDGRIEVKVTGGEGKVTAYASVVDNLSLDPLLVSGVPLGQVTAKNYVVPGVADINNGLASWRTDLRVFNSGTTPQAATLTFYPQGSAAITRSTTINPGEVKPLDNIVASLFGLSNAGGAVHVSTATDSSLVVSARTYNQTSNGTFGQFIPAVTAAQAIGNGSNSLQILQVEDSVRYRTNIGIAEVTGQNATAEVTVVLPDSRVTPKIQVPLAANEFKQIGIAGALGLENLYNARVSIRVIGGTGRITAYGSSIDQATQDPTFVPAQLTQ